jgi:hypothetical protein
MKRSLRAALKVAAAGAFVAASTAQAQVVRVEVGAFTPQAGQITFSEFVLGTENPTYAPATYGGGAGAPTVTFGGYFTGQSLGTASTCPPGAALSGCIVGSPTGGTLSFDAGAPRTRITSDGANPTSPVLSGSPTFNGPISVLFSEDQYGVGLDGGYFNAIGGTAITAFDRAGNVIGSVANIGLGIEFLGLVVSDGTARIAGLQYSLVGAEPAGFAIDNLRFGKVGEVVNPGDPVAAVPEPETYALMLVGLGALALVRRRRNRG